MKKITCADLKITFSIVSHGQLNLICKLLRDLQCVDLKNTLIIVTINIPEELSVLDEFNDLNIIIIKNKYPKGFGENHNFAFNSTICDYFIIANPDIRLRDFREDVILNPFHNTQIGAVSPVVFSPSGQIEDSARRFPTLFRLVKRTILRDRSPDYVWHNDPIDIDWSAGMFVVYRASAFKMVSGFDTRYFMYMEDADICLRLKRAGWRTVLQPKCAVIHDARRASHRNLRYLRWHIASVFRFLFLPARKVSVQNASD